MTIHGNAHWPIGAAVAHKDHITTCLDDSSLDGVGLLAEGPVRPVGIASVKTGKSHCRGVEARSREVFEYLVPGPGAQPMSGYQDDVRRGRGCRSGCREAILARRTDNGVSPLVA